MKHLIPRLFFLAFGAFIAGFGLEGFLIPNNMIDGGIAARFTVDLVQAFEHFNEDSVKI